MFVQILFWVIPLLFRSRRDQCFRIVALEQQLEVFQRQQGGRRLQLTDADRWFWVMLRGRWSRWREALVIVKPETVVEWHRKLGRWWQRWQSRPLGCPPLPDHVQALIRRMATENPFWGQDRIAGELEKLGIEVSPRSVAKYMGPRPGPPSIGWMAFLKAHGGHIWACDWLRVKTIGFKTLYVFVVLAHERRRVVHFHITEHPSDVWVAQQMVETMPFEQGPRFLIRDGDPLYGQTFKRRTANCGVRTIQISHPAPVQLLRGAADAHLAPGVSAASHHSGREASEVGVKAVPRLLPPGASSPRSEPGNTAAPAAAAVGGRHHPLSPGAGMSASRVLPRCRVTARSTNRLDCLSSSEIPNGRACARPRPRLTHRQSPRVSAKWCEPESRKPGLPSESSECKAPP